MVDIPREVADEGELADAINDANNNPDDFYTITFTANIPLSADLPVIQAAITIDGGCYTLYGTDPEPPALPDGPAPPSFRGLFVFSSGDPTGPGVVIQDLTISGAVAKGGDGGDGGGGGGAGMGGALFVNAGAKVTVSNVHLEYNSADGGNGAGAGAGYGGGGGGMGGNGGEGSSDDGGGGGGLGSGATGGTNGTNNGDGEPGIVAGAAGGGAGDGGGDGGDAGGGGGGGSDGGGGGGGVEGFNADRQDGGAGNFGGGGGGGGDGGNGGAGGFGGGGGGSEYGGGAGGYGGGGGAGTTPGSGGFGGGNGVSGGMGGGGGGAGLGGALFVMAGATLIIKGDFTVEGNTIQAGDGGVSAVNGGLAFGSGIFLQGGVLDEDGFSSDSLTFSPDSGEEQIVENDIFDEQGALYYAFYYAPPEDFVPGAWGLTKDGDGTLVLCGSNFYAGATIINAGVLAAESDYALSELSAFTVGADGILEIRSSVMYAAIGSLAGAGQVNMLEMASLEVGLNDRSTAFSGEINAEFGDFIKTGAGTMTLTGVSTIGGELVVCGCEPENTLEIDSGSFTALYGTAVEGGLLSLINGATLTTGWLSVWGRMTLDGVGTTATATEFTEITDDPYSLGPPSLEITGGASLDSAYGAIVCGEFGATAMISGSGSTWNIDGLLMIGDGDPDFAGAVSATGGGKINADGIMVFAGSSLLIGDGGLAGTIDTQFITNYGDFIANFTGTAEVSAAISGNGTLTKYGAGKLILAAGTINAFIGTTTVNGGVLQVDGSMANSAMIVNNGGTLGGNGTTGAVIVNAGGFVSAGASAGILTTGTLTFATPASVFKAELGGTTAGINGYDQVVVNGSVILAGAILSLSLLDGFVPSVGTTFTIIVNDQTDAVEGTFAGLAQGATFQAAGLSFSISYTGGDGNDVVLTALGAAPPQAGVTIIGTKGADVVDATHTVPGQPFPTELGDNIFGRGGGDTLSGLGGNDMIRGGNGKDAIFGNDGDDDLGGEAGADTIRGGAGDDLVAGGSGKDTLFGDDGNDVINGGQDNDVITGGNGDDRLSGGAGNNKLTGGEGADTFVFRTPKARDKILDFAEIDTIALVKSSFPGIGPKGVLKAKYFHEGSEAETRKQKILYDEDSGWLLYAKKGSATANPVKFAKIGKHLDDFDHTDILVI